MFRLVPSGVDSTERYDIEAWAFEELPRRAVQISKELMPLVGQRLSPPVIKATYPQSACGSDIYIWKRHVRKEWDCYQLDPRVVEWLGDWRYEIFWVLGLLEWVVVLDSDDHATLFKLAWAGEPS